MNSTQILQLLETIAQSPKKTDKERLLREATCPELERVFKAAYDPNLNYYIKKVPSVPVGVLNFTNWLLLDQLANRVVTGNAALEALTAELASLNLESQELLTRIIKRDLRCGINDSTINKVFPKLIPTYPYMRCNLLTKVDTSSWDWENGNISQIKMDGMFCNISVYQDEIVLQSRQGTVLPQEELQALVNYVSDNCEVGYQYHGELIVLDESQNVLPREIGNGIMNSVAKGGTLPEGYFVRFVVWDVVELDVINGLKKCETPYIKRVRSLYNLPPSQYFKVVETKRVFSLEHAYQHYQDALSRGCEGTVLKNRNMLWKNGTSKDQLKLKLEVDVDLEIIGFTEGKGKFANTFGSVMMQTRDGLLRTDVSGISDDMRLHIHLNRDKLLGTIATVRGNDVTKSEPASLYLPRIVELREDKSVADSLQEVIEQFENAKLGKI